MENLCFIDRSLQFSKIAHKSLGNPFSPSPLFFFFLAPFLFLPPAAPLSGPILIPTPVFPLSFSSTRPEQAAGVRAAGGRAAGRAGAREPARCGAARAAQAQARGHWRRALARGVWRAAPGCGTARSAGVRAQERSAGGRRRRGDWQAREPSGSQRRAGARKRARCRAA
jgi:hypothetical protein